MAKLSFNKPNETQTPVSPSALVNGAAKDDALGLSTTNTFRVTDLLANDPGAAIFYAPAGAYNLVGGGSIAYDAFTGIFSVTGTVTAFDYMIRLANGTYSQAHVTLADAGGPLFSDDFNSYAQPAEWATVSLAPKWTTAPTSGATEIAREGFQNTSGGDGGYWLDTQGSPGGIDISTTIADPNAGSARISLSLAVQQFKGPGTLQVFWNGIEHDINVSDFTVAPGTFQTFEWQVDSAVSNTLEIKDTGVGFIGFALDWVQVNDWIS